jgi:hypothetical protein
MSTTMTSIRRGHLAAASPAWATAVAASASLLLAATAAADPAPTPAPPAPAVPAGDTAPPSQGPHNITYRARVDGVSRGTLVTYRLTDNQLNSATPSLLPGEMFEASAVLNNAANAGMQVSIQWPYSASLHCEILVDDQIVAQADQFVAPRLTPQRQDPGYGVLSCGSVTDFDPTQQYSAELPGTPATPAASAH